MQIMTTLEDPGPFQLSIVNMKLGPDNRNKAAAPLVFMSLSYRQQEGQRAELTISTSCHILVIWSPLVSMEKLELLMLYDRDNRAEGI